MAILVAYKLKLHVAENLLLATVICLQDSENHASMVDITELDILPASEAIREDQVQDLLRRTAYIGNAQQPLLPKSSVFF